MLRTLFNDGYDLLQKIFDCNLLEFPSDIKDYLLNFLSSICKYEEEETKIKPSIIVGIDIERYISNIPGTKIITLMQNKLDNHKTRANLKSLLPLCNNGWTVFINFKKENDELLYGIIRDFGSISSLEFTDMLFDEIEVNKELIYFSVLSNNEILIKSDCNEDKIIDSRFIAGKEETNKEIILNNLCEDCLINYKYNEQFELLLNTCKKLFITMQQRLHGTILAIIDSKVDINKVKIFAKDSKILPDPVDIIKFAFPLLNNEGINAGVVQEYYAITGLLTTLMNTDGVCIIDNSFKIRAYNTFINIKTNNQPGGSRTRAFDTIKQRKDKYIVGCYFQSQDGSFDYWRNEKYARR